MAVEDWPPLVEPTELNDFPGAPFSADVVEAAAGQVRDVCGWHIAPSITETLVLDHNGSGTLHLSSLYVTAVAEVRDVSSDTPRVLTGWRWSQDGMISGRFPCGFRVVEVDLTHGHDVVPSALLPVLADRAQRRVRSQQAGPFSVTYVTDSDEGNPHTVALAKYTLPPRP